MRAIRSRRVNGIAPTSRFRRSIVTSFAIARGVRLAIAETIYPATAEGRSRVAPRFRLRIASHPDAGLGPS
jgi:hypothetical protein